VLIDVSQSDPLTVYHALVRAVAPRTIARVTTLYPQGRVNLAPFGFFNAFGPNPPVIVFWPNRKRDGGKKDALRNVEATGAFVVNAAVAELTVRSTSPPRSCRRARARWTRSRKGSELSITADGFASPRRDFSPS
jgi:flavin reductase (DIM6/NTAB) family NADH-FMN oxidoreductase RutF